MTDTLPTSVAIAPVNSAELTADAQSALQVADSMVIDSPAMYELAAQELADTKTQIAALTARREEITKPLTAAHKSVMALFKAPLDYLEQTKNKYSAKMVTFHTEQERIRQAEQARLEAAAKAERDRLEAEAKKALAEAKDDPTKMLEAQAKAAIAQTVVAVQVAAAPKVSGTSIRETWEVVVTDKGALVKHIAANYEQHPELLDYLDVNTPALNALARLHKQSFSLVGVRADRKQGITSRK